MGKGGPARRQPVEIRGVDVLLAQRVHALPSEVVGEKEQDIGFLCGVQIAQKHPHCD